MNRGRSRPPRNGGTLSEALSPDERGQLLRLRGTLEQSADEAFSRRLAEARPPWRKAPRPASTAKTPAQELDSRGHRRGPLNAIRKQPDPPRAVVQAKPTPTQLPESESQPADQGFAYWDFPHEAPRREPLPPPISDHEKSLFDDLLRTGAELPPADGEGLFMVLGVDFGTSSTKMIVRLPYEAGTPTIAIPAPAPCRVRGEPYLWKTLLWLRADGTFRPWPEPDAAVLDALKQGLIQGRSETEISGIAAPAPVKRAQAGAAFLAYAVRYARGWLLRNRPNLLRGRRPVWFLNLGIPAASYDAIEIANPYRRIGAAALELSTIDGPITARATQIFLDHRRVVDAGASEQAAEALGVAVFPETAAEMTGFAKSTRSAPDLYLLVDVGAMTLDACMFRLKPEGDGKDLYAFMAAEVRPLGVDSLHWFLAEGKTEAGFVQQCKRALRGVVWRTKVDRDPHATTWMRGNDVPVFLTGGGAAHRLHQEILRSLGPWLEELTRNDGIRLLELPVPENIDLPIPLTGFGRLAVAWGLSYPPTEIGRIHAMREVKDVERPARVDLSERYISKDQV